MAAFGTSFADTMAVATYGDDGWSPLAFQAVEPLPLHPAAHVLHYASSCFEGLKAYRHGDGSVHVFRLDRHIARMRESARLLCLPIPDESLLEAAIRGTVDAARDQIPVAPGALYLRPVLMGTDPSIGSAGSAATEACLYVLASPVGAYFSQDARGLRILLDDSHMRSAPHFGAAKSGGNYASALGPILAARRAHQTDQVLFCPGGDVQEAGAANFFLLDAERLITRPADSAILHGVTRDSLIELAGPLGYALEERPISVAEVLAWSERGEAALSGTAAVLAPIGTFIHDDREYPVSGAGAQAARLREALTAIHRGEAEDRHGWLTAI
jgi:branched-chain amino acid aminotransferase